MITAGEEMDFRIHRSYPNGGLENGMSRFKESREGRMDRSFRFIRLLYSG